MPMAAAAERLAAQCDVAMSFESDRSSDDQSLAAPEQSDDDGLESDVHSHEGPQTTTEKRKLENAILQARAQKLVAKVTREEIKDQKKKQDDESLSIRELLATQESSTKINTPRDYQNELFEKAKRQNTIAVLDTGSGKTHIATLLLRWVLDQELEDRAAGRPPKTAFFLVNSVNLVFQQNDHLSCNLSHKTEGLCGAQGAHLWDASTWIKHLKANMVIVCTAEILNQAMMHSFITIDLINLLIFDEAHHAKPNANHPYARIIKEYYLTESDLSKRPRIFGMTASPINANRRGHDLTLAAQYVVSQFKLLHLTVERDLEALLHCQIATASNMDSFRNFYNKPAEEVTEYKRLRVPFETPFHHMMKKQFGDLPDFQRFSDTAKQVASELGPWCSDIYWSFAFAQEAARRQENKATRFFNKRQSELSMAEYDSNIAKLKEAQRKMEEHCFGVPAVNEFHLSSKVLMLHDWLRRYFERPSDSRCIVFVTQRTTARLLDILFSHIGGENFNGAKLVGSGSGNSGDPRSSLRTQFLTISRFRKGELNCLFATSVAEEGLDIPDCNLIVRFDLYKTMIQYVQSRGRARRKNSHFLHMVQMGNNDDYETVLSCRQYERIMREFCETLPENRVVDNEGLEEALEKERGLRTYTDPESGAKLTYRSSLTVLAHFVDCLPKTSDIDAEAQPTYNISVSRGAFIGEVSLPGYSPVTSATGKPYSRKILAKCSAAFEACILLRKARFLDQNLLPIYAKVLPTLRNARIALHNSKGNYPIKIKPDFWSKGRGEIPSKLYITILDVSNGLNRPYNPIGLVTRQPMPQLPTFPIFLDDGTRTDVISRPVEGFIAVKAMDIEALTAFTIRIYEDLFAKIYEHNSKVMSYWLVPLRISHEQVAGIQEPEDLIDWGIAQEALNRTWWPWAPELPNSMFCDRFLVDQWDGGRRYYSIEVAPGVRPDDKVTQIKKGGKKVQETVLDYTVSLWKRVKDQQRPLWDRNQPVLKAERTSFRRNLLAPPDAKELDPEKRVYICPQPLKVSVIPPSMAAFCYVFPAIVWRYDSYLVAMEVPAMLGLDIGPALALEAVTKDSDNSGEHAEEKTNFRRGMGENYERLEFIGDCFLKMAASVSLFVLKPDENEFFQHVERMTMTSNKNLFNVALDLQLPEYVRSLSFSRRLWYPESIELISGKGAKFVEGEKREIQKHSLGDKTVADVCEALIGAALMQHNDPQNWSGKNWDNAVKAVSALVASPDHFQKSWDEYIAAYKIPAWQTLDVTASQRDMAAKVEAIHPYHFKYPRLLRSAFMHGSNGFMIERIPDYQRLEFLGDSLLDMVFMNDIFYRYPDKDPQWLTEHKMPMVSNKFLGALCVKLGFHPHIRRSISQLDGMIKDWVDEMNFLETNAKGEVDYWTAAKEPPKILADVVEAYIGAIFVDSGFNFAEIQRFYKLHIAPFFADMAVYDSFANNHPTTRLQELLGVHMGCHDYRIATAPVPTILPGAKSKVGVFVMVHCKIVAETVAESGRYGRVRVSKMALDLLDGLPPFEYRLRYGCDCKAAEGFGEETVGAEVK